VDLVQNLSDAFLYFFPGFLGLKVFYVFGLRTQRTDLEWGVWSVFLSVVLSVLADPVRSWVGVKADDGLYRAALVAAGLIAGLLLVVMWNSRLIRTQRWRLVAEPWDIAYWKAIDDDLQASVELIDGREAYGDIAWMGLRGEGSSRSITLANVQISDGEGAWTSLPPDEEVHIPEATVKLLRLVPHVPLSPTATPPAQEPVPPFSE
jgi:hypothetical protein